MNITYRTDVTPTAKEVIAVYDSSQIVRPTDDEKRIEEMYRNSNLIVTAYHNDKLVGVGRGFTDFSYACYLSDLAVDLSYQKQGIGRKILEIVHKEIGARTALILLAAAPAMEYYPKVGFEKIENGFIIKRTE